MGKPTFPDQQQDLQNATGFRVTGQCDASVKVLTLLLVEMMLKQARRWAWALLWKLFAGDLATGEGFGSGSGVLEVTSRKGSRAWSRT
jgi:hypothetical protein